MSNTEKAVTDSRTVASEFQLQTFDKHQGWQTLESFNHLTDADEREHEIQDSFREQGLDVKTRVQKTDSRTVASVRSKIKPEHLAYMAERLATVKEKTASAQPENVRGFNLICMSFDGEYVTEKQGFETIQEAWNHAADLGSRWFFYPYAFVTTASGKTIRDTPEMMAHLKGMRVKAVAKHFASVSKTPEAQNMDAEAFAFLI